MTTLTNHAPLIEPQTAQRPADFLRGIFLDRKSRNPSYSTRSYARDLGISQALLSLILNGKRPLTVKQAAQMSVLLGHSTEESRRFLESTLLSLPENSKALSKLRKMRSENPEVKNALQINYDVERHKVISHWYHFALLDLTTVQGFKSEPSWIAKRLRISTLEVKDAIERLTLLGLLESENGELRKSEVNFSIVTKNSEAPVRNFHKQMIAKAVATLDRTGINDFEQREISGTTMAIRMDRLHEAKKRIQKFQKEMAEFMTDGECQEVFQLNVQFFSLTQNTKDQS